MRTYTARESYLAVGKKLTRLSIAEATSATWSRMDTEAYDVWEQEAREQEAWSREVTCESVEYFSITVTNRW